MNKLSVKKIVLLSLIAVFLCIYIVQLVNSGKTNVKTIYTKGISSIEISYNDGSDEVRVKLVKNGDSYLVGNEKFDADEVLADELFDSLNEIKILGKVSSLAGNEERYGFNTSVEVKALNAKGKTVRSVTIGKDNSTNTQSYITVDGDDEICVIQGALHSIFAVTEAKLRSKIVFDVAQDSIVKVYVKTDSEEYSIERSSENESGWKLTLNNTSFKNIELDGKKINAWIRNIAALDAEEWLADDVSLYKPESDVDAVITTTTGVYTLRLYAGKDKDQNSQAVCSATPYKFTVPSYVNNKYGKSLDELTVHQDAE